jgi:hypothetical protein
MSDRRAVYYLVFPNFYGAPFLVCLFSEYRDIYRAWRLVVIDSTVYDFCRALKSIGTASVSSRYNASHLTYHVRHPSTLGQKDAALLRILQF